MRRSCRCFAAAAQHPKGRRAQLLVLSMRAAKPTAGPSLSLQQFGSHTLDMLAPRFCFLRPEHPADPLIAGKRGEVFPSRENLRAINQDTSQVHRDGMDHSAGDNPGTHRSPIVALKRTDAAWGHRNCMTPCDPQGQNRRRRVTGAIAACDERAGGPAQTLILRRPWHRALFRMLPGPRPASARPPRSSGCRTKRTSRRQGERTRS